MTGIETYDGSALKRDRGFHNGKHLTFQRAACLRLLLSMAFLNHASPTG
jgi:hypothetical protein